MKISFGRAVVLTAQTSNAELCHDSRKMAAYKCRLNGVAVQTTFLSFEIDDVKRFLRRTTFMLYALQVEHCDAIRIFNVLVFFSFYNFFIIYFIRAPICIIKDLLKY